MKKKSFIESISYFRNLEIMNYLDITQINETSILKLFLSLLSKEFKKKQFVIKVKNPSKSNVNYYFNTFVKLRTKKNKNYDFIETIGNIIFNINDINSSEKKNNSEISKYILNEVNSLLTKNKQFIFKKSKNILNIIPKLFFGQIINYINSFIINEFIKKNHLLFLTDDEFQFTCFEFFFIINQFISEIYGLFSDYEEFILNFYYLYYKYSQNKNLSDFKLNILSKIIPEIDKNFSVDKNNLNANFIENLSSDLIRIINNNINFKLNINEKLFNNSSLLQLFHLKKIDKDKVKKFFRFPLVERNNKKLELNSEEKFDVTVDDLEYKEDKLHVFNIFFIIGCRLLDKITNDSLQIFNEDNNVITLFKKYANILIENINKIIENINEQNNDNSIILNTEEKFGFGKIFRTFYVLYTDLNNDTYRKEKLKYDLNDTLVKKNTTSKNILKINFLTNASEVNTNFTKITQNSNINMNEEQIYYQNLNSQALEDGCKDYIFSKIEELIEDNIDQIRPIELYKILFSLNYFIPCIDKDYTLKFKPVSRKMNNSTNNFLEYGFQEFDCLFKVLSSKDLSINNKKNIISLPFVKNFQVKINCINWEQNNIKIDIENNNDFLLKSKALVLIENKIKFPNKKELFIEYITIMVKKLNFIIKLIRNTTNGFRTYENIQLLLIYNDIIFNTENLEKYISKEDIKEIMKKASFTENVKFTIEIVYISQVMHSYNISNVLNKMHKMESELEEMKKKLIQKGII